MITIGKLKLDIQHSYDKEGRNVVVAQIFDLENKLKARAKTTCSKQDSFNKKRGRKIAISKALTGSSIPKSQRKEFWESYRTDMTKTPRW